jgi:2-polyprenyl-3-methyl-5-hydroxy-6-metoxy-1,4-benzoquinol methylase
MRSEEEMISYALEIEPSLLHCIPELLADLVELGSDADLIVKILQDLQLPISSRVIDLGCGKGAVSVEIADELGFQVLGIELFEPFIESCKELAAQAGISHLCEFRHGDILKLVNQVEPSDVVIFAALGDTLGPLNETIKTIRQFAKPSGFILVSDAFVKDGGSTSFPGFEQYTSREEAIRRLTAHGDTLVTEILEAPSASVEDDDESDLIYRRAKKLAKDHPELEQQLLDFAENQKNENVYIAQNLVGTVWVVQKSR